MSRSIGFLLVLLFAMVPATADEVDIDGYSNAIKAGINFYRQKDYVQAETSYKRALELVEQKPGQEERVADVLQNLAILYEAQGKKELLEEAQSKRFAVLSTVKNSHNSSDLIFKEKPPEVPRQIKMPEIKLQVPKPEVFDRPAENRSCSTDTDAGYNGVTYKGLKLGMSFRSFKDLITKQQLLPYLKRVNHGDNPYISSYKLEGAKLTIADRKWDPEFTFVDDHGAYRLSEIQGFVVDFDSLTNAFLIKYHKPFKATSEAALWVIGNHPVTHLMLTDPTRGMLHTCSFTHSDLIVLKDKMKEKWELQRIHMDGNKHAKDL